MNYLEYELLVNKEFLSVLRDLIDTAKKRVYIASYIASLSNATKDIYYALAYKNREGLDVKIILNGASQEALKYNKETMEFLNNLGVRHVKLTEKFTHIKLYIVDDYFIIGSHNLSASSYLNRYELSLMIHSKPMTDKLSDFFHNLLVYEDTEPIIYRDVIGNNIYYEVIANFKILRDIYEKTLFARERVKILMYIATLSKPTIKYYELLKMKEEEKLEVGVLLNGASKLSMKYNRPVYEYLMNLGFRKVLLTKRFIHAKMFIIDDYVILGSHNLTAASIAGRLELTLAIQSCSLANSLDYVFNKLYEDEASYLNRERGTDKTVVRE